MTYESQLGQFGENLACQYLIKRGYKIIERNFRRPWGELDVIVKAPDKTLVFIEVKTLRQIPSEHAGEGLQPEEQLTKSKLQKLKRTASLYAGHFPKLIDDNKGWRIDLVALTLGEKSCLFKHYKNI